MVTKSDGGFAIPSFADGSLVINGYEEGTLLPTSVELGPDLSNEVRIVVRWRRDAGDVTACDVSLGDLRAVLRLLQRVGRFTAEGDG